MNRAASSAAVAGTALIALFGLAFIVAPHACQGGFDLYFWSGVVVSVLLFAVPFMSRMGNSWGLRSAAAFGFAMLGICVWLAGLFAANVRFICGLGYL